MTEFWRKLPTYLPLEKLLYERKSSIKILTGDQDPDLVSLYCKCHNIKPLILKCNLFSGISELIVATYRLIFPHTDNLSNNKIIDQFYSFLKKTVQFNFVFFFENIKFITDIKSFKKQKFYLKIVDFQSINPGIHIFLFNCTGQNCLKSYKLIDEVIVFNNIYLHDSKNLVLKFIFGNSSSKVQKIIYNCLNEIKLGKLLYEIEQFVPFDQFDKISLINIKLIQLNHKLSAHIPPSLTDLKQTEKQLLKLLLNNVTKINTIKSLTGQFFNIYRENINILPIIENLTEKGFIKCNKALNCDHIRTDNNEHCLCYPTNFMAHKPSCRICCFTICSGLAYNINSALKDFILLERYQI